jgi:hypothetical protein
MFCDGCGTAVQVGQPFCSRCGKQIVGTVAMMPRRGRVQEHIHLVGILWLALSAFNVIGGVILFIMANTFLAPGGGANAPHFLHFLLSAVAIFILVKSLTGFIAGWGLTQREPWARILVLVLAFISLFNVPFGTAVGSYTMWVLLASGSEEEYDTLVSARAAA